MNLSNKFDQNIFQQWVEKFLPDFKLDIRKVEVSKSFSSVNSVLTLGESELGIRVYVIETNSDPSKRKVGLTTESFSLLKNYGTPNALIAYYSKDNDQWRLSLLTSTPKWNEGKLLVKLSNPKRQSYVLGPKAKINTPHNYLITKGNVVSFDDLKNRFSLEVVNKEFYKEISKAFTELIGGSISHGKSKDTFISLLKLPSIAENSQILQEFAVRLIGRIIFCWFLREKRNPSGHSLMPKELLSAQASKDNKDYYHNILEPIFFEILNKPIKSRKEKFINELFSSIPYLNGGLFSPHDDFYSYNEGKQAINHNLVVIPDKWFQSIFDVLETYNFTIDENTSFDEELSIDPEMLGRIFENLLAEINPDTGESARKSTGSYYTPREIVDYMIDESLFQYLSEHTDINENKLKSLISYDLDDDLENPLDENEKNKIAEQISKIKILDPACGSGAFPIGALQKIVFILQQIDPRGQLWFKKQMLQTQPELRRLIEKEFQEKNFDYLRKLGIIRENIYGIDIQPIATEISRLRCFLTLVVDERIDETQENRGVQPLPNLDFKFVTANSLIRLPKNNNPGQIDMFDNQDKIDELKFVRDQYFTSSGIEREQLKSEFNKLQKEMIFQLVQEHGLMSIFKAELTHKLTEWDPFSHRSTDWFDSEWMFGVKDGFDIVIANPPYETSRSKGINEDLKKYFKNNYISAEDKYDYYVIFMELATKLAKNNGQICLITPSTYMLKPLSRKIRKLLLTQCAIISIDEFKGLVFQAVVPTSVIIFKNRVSNLNDKIRISYDIRSTSDFLNHKYLHKEVKQNEFNKEPNYYINIYADDIFFKLFDKITHYTNIIKLGDLAEIYNGIQTGDDKKYIKFTKESEDWKEVIVGSDINLYYKKWGGKYVYYMPSKLHSNTRKDIFDTDEKIIIRQTSDRIIGAYDNEKYFTLASTFIIKQFEQKLSYKSLLGILNSKLFLYLYRNINNEAGRVLPQIKKKHVYDLPIVYDFKATELDSFVNKILNITCLDDYLSNSDKQNEVKEIEKEIDQIVYKLYGLAEDEIKIVENIKI